MKPQGNILITGGAGFLGRAIVRRAMAENWNAQFTILSRDPTKHHRMQTELPDCRYIVGDICDYNSLVKAFAGHDIVIHAAALKHIPECESNPAETMRVNYQGSVNVARAAFDARVKIVVGISTDKACAPINIYGVSKLAMERLFQKFNTYTGTQFNLVRYGNVLGSTGSVLTVWNQMLQKGGIVTATDPDMTRFWMTVDDAVNVVLKSMAEPGGTITIPKCRALDMRCFAEYTMPAGTKFKYSGLRPGEKRYEELLTPQEKIYATHEGDYFRLWPVGDARHDPLSREVLAPPFAYLSEGYRSDSCGQLTRAELLEMLK